MKYIKQLLGLKDQVKTKIQTTFTTVGTHQLTKDEHIGQNIQGFKIISDDKGNKKRIPHIGFSSDLDYLDGFINRLILKLENLGLISINSRDKK